MKAHLTALMALLLLGATAFAQEEEPPFFKQFSVEIATGEGFPGAITRSPNTGPSASTRREIPGTT